MELSGNKKIVLLGLALLIVAGIVVVVLRGFNLPIIYQKHEAINFKVGNNIDMKKMNNICKEVFGDKEYNIRELELFGDSATISAENFTDEEKNGLVEKINAEFGTSFAVPKEEEKTEPAENAENTENAEQPVTPPAETETTSEDASEDTNKKEITVHKVPNYRLRDMARVYAKQSIIVALVVAAYMIVRFHSVKPIEKIAKLVALLVLSELAILSVIAIVRIPLMPVLINILAMFALVLTICYIGKLEKESENGEANS